MADYSENPVDTPRANPNNFFMADTVKSVLSSMYYVDTLYRVPALSSNKE